jgi:hypothetical protein
MTNQAQHSSNYAAQPLEVFMADVLVSLALLMKLSPAQTVALPTVIEVSAGKAGMSQEAFIEACADNAPLREYLAGICQIGAEALA